MANISLHLESFKSLLDGRVTLHDLLSALTIVEHNLATVDKLSLPDKDLKESILKALNGDHEYVTILLRQWTLDREQRLAKAEEKIKEEDTDESKWKKIEEKKECLP